MFEESGECVSSVFDWFGEPLGLSGWCEGKYGLDVRNLMGSPKHREGSVTRFSVNLGHSVSI